MDAEKITVGDYRFVSDMIDEIHEKYPVFEKAESGKTLLGRGILTLKIGDGAETALYVGATHGQEYITELVLLRFLYELSEAVFSEKTLFGFDVKKVLARRSLIIIPALNPDGVEIALKGEKACGKYGALCKEACQGDFSNWNANARGVDINHNFNAGWRALHGEEEKNGIVGPAPRRYGGLFPESEPETTAITRLCRNVRPEILLTLHSQGQEIYWEYGENTPQKSLALGKAFAGVSGYTLVKNEGLAAAGGLKDWFIDELQSPAFTLELGIGHNPLPVKELDRIYEEVKEILMLGLVL